MAQTSAKAVKPSVFTRFSRYINDVMAEMRRVVWPSRPEVINSSMIVIVTLTIFIILIGILDVISASLVQFLARLGG